MNQKLLPDVNNAKDDGRTPSLAWTILFNIAWLAAASGTHAVLLKNWNFWDVIFNAVFIVAINVLWFMKLSAYMIAVAFKSGKRTLLKMGANMVFNRSFPSVEAGKAAMGSFEKLFFAAVASTSRCLISPPLVGIAVGCICLYKGSQWGVWLLKIFVPHLLVAVFAVSLARRRMLMPCVTDLREGNGGF